VASPITGLEPVWAMSKRRVKSQSSHCRQPSLQLVTIFPIMATVSHRNTSSAGHPVTATVLKDTCMYELSFGRHDPASKGNRISMVRRLMGASNAGIRLPTDAAPLTRRTEPSVSPTRKPQQCNNEYTSKNCDYITVTTQRYVDYC
jgi:hypothetical protein